MRGLLLCLGRNLESPKPTRNLFIRHLQIIKTNMIGISLKSHVTVGRIVAARSGKLLFSIKIHRDRIICYFYHNFVRFTRVITLLVLSQGHEITLNFGLQHAEWPAAGGILDGHKTIIVLFVFIVKEDRKSVV